jgi:hypothetical protein
MRNTVIYQRHRGFIRNGIKLLFAPPFGETGGNNFMKYRKPGSVRDFDCLTR